MHLFSLESFYVVYEDILYNIADESMRWINVDLVQKCGMKCPNWMNADRSLNDPGVHGNRFEPYPLILAFSIEIVLLYDDVVQFPSATDHIFFEIASIVSELHSCADFVPSGA